MIFEVIADVAKLALIVSGLYIATGLYARHRQPTWSEPLERRRIAWLCLLVLGTVAIKVSEDAIGGESGFVDKVVLTFVHANAPPVLNGFFNAVTVTGSARVLIPLTVAAAVALLFARRRIEATLLASSVTIAAAIVYVVKALVGRARPALWQTDWYWGSSFPSGHTLVVTAFATAWALTVARMWPRGRVLALSTAAVWVGLVAMSRLVLGVHWPTDVLAAACVGAALPLAISLGLELRKA
jgi:undecaprenyl-diphosphatase